MGCSSCKKKTYFERAKDIDKKARISVAIGIILIGLACYGLYTLISNLVW